MSHQRPSRQQQDSNPTAGQAFGQGIPDSSTGAPAPEPRPGTRSGILAKGSWVLAGFFGPLSALAALLLVALLAFPPARTNVLILGTDRRPGEIAPSRTDTVLLVTGDPSKPYMGMLSIPRDLWVRLPDGGENRINAAYHFAELAQPGSGPSAAVSTVQNNFGLPIDGYVLIDFKGFVRLIDAAGGVEINVPEPLVDYDYPTDDYGVTTVTIEAGPQRMDGEVALAYARIRHGTNDLQRVNHQQQIVQALLAQLLDPAAIPRYPAVFKVLTRSVESDLALVQLLRLAPTIILVGPAGIHREVLQGEMVQPYTTAQGASVLLPLWEEIRPLLAEMFGG